MLYPPAAPRPAGSFCNCTFSLRISLRLSCAPGIYVPPLPRVDCGAGAGDRRASLAPAPGPPGPSRAHVLGVTAQGGPTAFPCATPLGSVGGGVSEPPAPRGLWLSLGRNLLPQRCRSLC